MTEPNTFEEDSHPLSKPKLDSKPTPLKKQLQLHSLKVTHGPLIERAHKTLQALVYSSQYILGPETHQLALAHKVLSIAAQEAPGDSFRITKDMELSVSATSQFTYFWWLTFT